jgi:transcriptional regulator with XRE-family HTH domain
MTEKKELNILVGNNIKREREKAGLTQDQFSEMLGIGSKSLSAIERGVVGISLTTLLKICDTLSVSTNTILKEKCEKNNIQNITDQLERLTPSQLEIAEDMLHKLIKAFALEE